MLYQKVKRLFDITCEKTVKEKTTVNSFHRETQKPLRAQVYDQGGFGHSNTELLAVASNPGLQYEIVVGYVELLHTRLSGGEGKRSLSFI